MDKPVVSILIPAYNAATYLPQCLDSVLKQTYRDLQVVIVDDGSKDNSLEVCKEYTARDARVEVYHQENQGVAATRNHLLDKVKGDYVLFVDADDWIEPDMVEYLTSLAADYNSEMVMCDRVINDEKPSEKESEVNILQQEKAICDFLYHDYFVGSLWNKLISRNILQNERFHRGISYGEDALFCWRALQKVNNVVVCNKQLYHYRMNEDSISHQSFGEKKLTGHLTWTIICEDVKKCWPQYTNLALCTFALQDMYLLQQASMSGYPKDEHIKVLQQNVRENYKYLTSGVQKTRRILVIGAIIMYWYGFGSLYAKMYNIKAKLYRLFK